MNPEKKNSFWTPLPLKKNALILQEKNDITNITNNVSYFEFNFFTVKKFTP